MSSNFCNGCKKSFNNCCCKKKVGAISKVVGCNNCEFPLILAGTVNLNGTPTINGTGLANVLIISSQGTGVVCLTLCGANCRFLSFVTTAITGATLTSVVIDSTVTTFTNQICVRFDPESGILGFSFLAVVCCCPFKVQAFPCNCAQPCNHKFFDDVKVKDFNKKKFNSDSDSDDKFKVKDDESFSLDLKKQKKATSDDWNLDDKKKFNFDNWDDWSSDDKKKKVKAHSSEEKPKKKAKKQNKKKKDCECDKKKKKHKKH